MGRYLTLWTGFFPFGVLTGCGCYCIEEMPHFLKAEAVVLCSPDGATDPVVIVRNRIATPIDHVCMKLYDP